MSAFGASIDGIDSNELATWALAATRPLIALAIETADFQTATPSERLAEIDAALGGNDTLQSLSRADLRWVAPSVRDLPGCEAFAELLEAPSAATGSDALLGLGRSLVDLYRDVVRFLARLREGLFGFHRETSLYGSRVVVTVQLDSDIAVSVVPLTTSVPTALAAFLGEVLENVEGALSVFAKVMSLVGTVVLAARSPWHAVRALWSGLRQLYELVVRRRS